MRLKQITKETNREEDIEKYRITSNKYITNETKTTRTNEITNGIKSNKLK